MKASEAKRLTEYALSFRGTMERVYAEIKEPAQRGVKCCTVVIEKDFRAQFKETMDSDGYILTLSRHSIRFDTWVVRWIPE